MNEAIFYVWGKKRKALCWKLAVESREIAARLLWWDFIPTYAASLTSVGLAASEKVLTSHQRFVFKKPQEVFLSSLMMIGILILVSKYKCFVFKDGKGRNLFVSILHSVVSHMDLYFIELLFVYMNNTIGGCWSVVQNLVGGQTLVMCQWDFYRVLTLTSSLVIWMMGQSTSSANLLITQNWEEWLIHQKVVLPSRGTLAGWRNGLTRTSCSCEVVHECWLIL